MRKDLVPDAVAARFTRGTGVHTIASKLVVADLPVQSNTLLDFNDATALTYRALLYELHDKPSGALATKSPNWFGVALPTAFDLTGDVFVIIYFHPLPGQAKYNDADYQSKSGAGGTDWKQLYAYVDRLGGQMAGAIKAGAKANRLVVFPFLKSSQYTVPTSEWFNIVHDILQDINKDIVPRICTRPKKVIVATLSNGTVYLDKFLQDTSALPTLNSKVIEAWDFDTDFVIGQAAPLNPHNRRLRAYWQGSNTIRPNTAPSTYIKLPLSSWANFPQGAAIPVEIPPLPPKPSNSNPANGSDATEADRVHHCIRDTMFLDAVINIEADNP